MIQSLAGHAGSQVGHQRDAQDIHPSFARGDGFVDRGHAHQPRTQGAQHVDLRGGFILRTRHHRVNSLAHAGAELLRAFAQLRGVGIHQVHEVGTTQGGLGGEVDVIADQHGLTHLHALHQATGCVGQHHGAHTSGGCGAHGMRGAPELMTLIRMGATQ